MKKKHILIIVGTLSVVIAVSFVLRTFFWNNDVIYIAAVRPGQDTAGEAMLQGIRLYLDSINIQGGIVGKKIKLLALDDHNDIRMALSVASDIILEDKALLVLGHGYSTPSIAAGDVYGKSGIPAITASATAVDVTSENEWYFSVIPDSRVQAEFIAHYMKYVLKQNSVSMIVDTDSYGSSLAEHFVKAAAKLDLAVNGWKFDTENAICFKLTESSFQGLEEDGMPEIVLDDLKKNLLRRIFCTEDTFWEAVQAKIGEEETARYQERILEHVENANLDETLDTIVSELRSIPDPGAILFATYQAEAVKIITSLKFPGTNYTIIGSDSFSTNSFIEEFRKYPQEHAQPGYYSDGIYAISPFMLAIADEKAYAFREEFIRKYGQEPSWVAAGYYDAAHVAVEAIKRAGIQGAGHIRDDRRKIKEALTRFNSDVTAVGGVTGSIYFNSSGSVERPLAMGQYERHKFLPSFSQYQLISSDARGPKAEGGRWKAEGGRGKAEGGRQKRGGRTPDGEIIHIAGKSMARTNIVYTGIDINEISNLDFRNSRYTVDFFLWFRFQRDFDDDRISFVNAVDPVTLDPPIAVRKTEQSTTHTYRVIADFSNEFAFQAYPFDQQTIRVTYHHANLSTNTLMYAPDLLRMPLSEMGTHAGKTLFNEMSGWSIDTILCRQDIFNTHADISQDVLNFSQFHAEVKIMRKGLRDIVRVFFPMIIMIMVLYFIYFMPTTRTGTHSLIYLSILFSNTLYYRQLISRLPRGEHILTIEYVFFTIYVLTAIAAYISMKMYRLHKRKATQKIPFFVRTGRIIHPLIVLIVGFLLTYIYY